MAGSALAQKEQDYSSKRPSLDYVETTVTRQVHEGLYVEGQGGTWLNTAPRGPGACTTAGCFVTRDGGALPSDTNAEFFVGVPGSRFADNFSVTSNQITELCFWGSYDDNLLPPSDSFRVAFFTDDTSAGGGLPGSLITGGFFNLTVGANPGQIQRSATGQLDDAGFEIHEFHVTFSTPVNVTANSCIWVSIINTNTGASRIFNWATDDGNSIHDDGVSVGTGGTNNAWPVADTVAFLTDFAFCVNDMAPPQGCGSLVSDCQQDIDAGSFSCQGIGGGSGLVSRTSGIVVADNWTPLVSGNITEICFAGFYSSAGNFQRTAADQFQLNIFRSTPDGLPDVTNVVAQFSSATHTFDYGSLFPFSIHTLTLPTPVAVTAGECLWIEILNDTAGNNWVWANSAPVDNLIGIDGLFTAVDGFYAADEVVNAIDLGAAGSDMAFCVSVDMAVDPGCFDTTPPANDSCFSATPVTVNGASVVGTIRNASAEFGVPPCGIYGVGETGDVFHTVTTGTQPQQLTATTCNAGTEFDTVLNIYCFADGSSCGGGLFCVTGGDDDADCISEPLATTVTWEAAANTTYVILVAGRLGGGVGNYELSVTGQASVSAPEPCQACDVDTSGATLLESAVETCGDNTNDIFNTPGFDCTMVSQTAGPGTTVAGEAFADGALGRDLDFFRLPDPATNGGLLFTVQAEQPMLWIVWETADGLCPDAMTAPIVVALTVPCETLTFAAPVLVGNDYLFQVVPFNFDGAPCFTGTTEYTFSVATAPEGACCLDDGTCQPSFGTEDCDLVFGGTYAGDGTLCSDVGVCDTGPTCVCELDGVAGVDVFDLLAFLDLWFAQAAGADIDGVAGVDVFDLLFFLDCWFPASAGNPCP